MTKSLYSTKYERLCDLLVEARKKRNLTQSAVSAALGKPQSFVSKYERRERRLDVVEFVEVADALGLDPCELLRDIRKH